MSCRICGAQTRTILDLGNMPPANHLTESREAVLEEFPLVLEGCECGCFQLRDCLDAEVLYRDYSYVTPRVASLERHYDALLGRLRGGGYIDRTTDVLEIGSNSGDFLRFLRPHVRSVCGVDPARAIAQDASVAGVTTIPEFFNATTAASIRAERGPAGLVVARHVLAHNCDPYLMLAGVEEVLADDGTLVVENAYAIRTFENNEFDQIYHEHMFYYTLLALSEMLQRRGFAVCDAVESTVHGGSIVCIARRAAAKAEPSASVRAMLEYERVTLKSGLAERFVVGSERIRADVQAAVSGLVADGRAVAAYGASAKGATLLNACGLTFREISHCADSTALKWGRFMPKCGVEIVSEEWSFAHPPDVFLLTAWNYREELIEKVRQAGLGATRFITPIPEVALS